MAETESQVEVIAFGCSSNIENPDKRNQSQIQTNPSFSGERTREDSCYVLWAKKNMYWRCMKPGRINCKWTMVISYKRSWVCALDATVEDTVGWVIPIFARRHRRDLKYQPITRSVEVLKTWTGKCTTPWNGSAADDTHHIDNGSGSSFLKRRPLIYFTGFERTLCCCFWSEVECNG